MLSRRKSLRIDPFVAAHLTDSFPFGSLRASAHRLHFVSPSALSSDIHGSVGPATLDESKAMMSHAEATPSAPPPLPSPMSRNGGGDKTGLTLLHANKGEGIRQQSLALFLSPPPFLATGAPGVAERSRAKESATCVQDEGGGAWLVCAASTTFMSG
jgi:hypothetical protein